MLVGARTAAWSGGTGYITEGLVFHIDAIKAIADGAVSDLAGGALLDYAATPWAAQFTDCYDDLHDYYEFVDITLNAANETLDFNGTSSRIIGPAVDMNGSDWPGYTIEVVHDKRNGNFACVGWTWAGAPFRTSITGSSSLTMIYGDNCYDVVSGESDQIAIAVQLTNKYSGGGVVGNGYENGVLVASRSGYLRSDFRKSDYDAVTDAYLRVGCYEGDVGGKRNGNCYFYRDQLKSVRIYNRALTAAEIAANYAIDKARFGLT